MSKNQDENLDRILRQRRAQPASPDLAGRIILKAQSLPQLENNSLWAAVRQLFVEFHLPKPAYVLAGTLGLGMALGFGTAPENGQSSDAGISTAQSYLAGDEGLL